MAQTDSIIALDVTARRLASLKAQLVRLDKPIAEHIEASPPLADRARLLHSIPGVGPVLCTAFLAFLPELGQLTRHQAAASSPLESTR